MKAWRVLSRESACTQKRFSLRRLAKRSSRRCSTVVVSPADWLRFSRFRRTIQQGPVKWQEWQIVQSQLDLRDLLP